MEASCLD
ncbi:hypothetical protein RDI58_022609 [Solanum bulbocastanum]